MCFQGTVLGPALWNAFFYDVATPAEFNGEISALFADDLNAFRSYDASTDTEAILHDMNTCQSELHSLVPATATQ